MGGAHRLREFRLKALKLALEIKRAEEDNKVLKAEVRNGNDLLRQERRLRELKEELAQIKTNERKLAEKCCFGPPDWSGKDDKWNSMQDGVEVIHTAVKSNITDSKINIVPDATTVGHGQSGHHVDFSYTSRPIKLQIYKQPFAMGGLRMAFYARDETGRKLVAKRALEEHHKLKTNIIGAHLDAEAAALSQLVANDFTRNLQKLDSLKNSSGSTARVNYLSANVALLPDIKNPGNKLVYILEPFMENSGVKWKKFTLNDGSILDDGKKDPVMQAFVHFSMQYRCCKDTRSGPLAVLDTQGVKNKDEYKLTDPALASPSKIFGRADFGSAAVEKFMKEHTCCSLCHALHH